MKGSERIVVQSNPKCSFYVNVGASGAKSCSEHHSCTLVEAIVEASTELATVICMAHNNHTWSALSRNYGLTVTGKRLALVKWFRGLQGEQWSQGLGWLVTQDVCY